MRNARMIGMLSLAAMTTVGCGYRSRYAPVYTQPTYFTAGGVATVQQPMVQQPMVQQPQYAQPQYTQPGYDPNYAAQPQYVQQPVVQQPVMQQPSYTQQPVLDTTVYGSPVILNAQPTVYYYQPTGIYRRPARWGGNVVFIAP